MVLKITSIVEAKEFEYDPILRILTGSTGKIRISYKQGKLMTAFAKYIDQVLSRDRLMDILYGDDDDAPYDKIIDVYIVHLRQALDKVECNVQINTVWGTGWVLRKRPLPIVPVKNYMQLQGVHAVPR